jgi:uncharacterized protein YdaU (DUF1376 family)
MKKDHLPVMPFYVRDYITATRGLTLAERGAYFDLLCIEWASGSPLPADPARLASLIGCQKRTFEALWPSLRCKFEMTPDGYINERLESERRIVLAKRERAAEKAAHAASARWELRKLRQNMLHAPSTAPSMNSDKPKDAPSNASSILRPMLGAMLEQCPPDPDPDPYPNTPPIQEGDAAVKRARSAHPKGSRARPQTLNEQDAEVRRRRREAAEIAERLEKAKKASES